MSIPANLTPAYSFTIEELGILAAAISATLEHAHHYGVNNLQTQMVVENPGRALQLVTKLTSMLEVLI